MLFRSNKIHICFYATPFGVIPIELDEVYPLSQHETVLPPDEETVEYAANQVTDYINRKNYRGVVLLKAENWHNSILKNAKQICKKKNIKFKHINFNGKPNKNELTNLTKILNKMLSE